MIRVAVAGAAGRMGEMVCATVEGADDMSLTGRADPQLGTSVQDVLAEADVLVDFTQPDTALDNARAALAAELYGADRLSAACVGADEDLFRKALAPVSESLVAA